MNSIITIGRQLGSGGKYVGEQLALRLGIPCYDKELINLASRESGLDKAFFEKADEKSRFSVCGHFFGLHSGYMTGSTGNYLCNEALFKIQSDVIRKLAGESSCIFVGRCADYILRDHRHCLKVFICADLPDRLERLMHERHLSEKDARLLLDQSDKKRAGYYNYYTNKIWGMASSYDLCLNSSAFGFEELVRMIAERGMPSRQRPHIFTEHP
ncbi:MAG: cytidylate kinase-like family protein [Prevotellaceae bacterium]|jgi:cytidylate kinase|nr:cytidylate kinase-like family protein [Prevotellaceae bacterium]